MRSLTTVIIVLILALWVVAIAIVSIQNVFIVDTAGTNTLISLEFLGFSSIKMPFGVLLALSAATGMLATSILLPLLQKVPPSLSQRSRNKI